MSKHADINKLSLYLDGRLPQDESRLIDEHLAACAGCKDSFLSLKASKDMLANLPQAEASKALDSEFKKRLEFEEDMRPAVSKPAPVFVKAVALVTAIAFLAVTVVWNNISVMPAIASIDGKAEIYRQKEARWRDAEKGMRLGEGDMIKVAGGGRVNIESKRYEIMLKENTEITASSLERRFKKDREITYGLGNGKVLVATKKGFEGSSLKIDSPAAEIEATGTGFMVNASSSSRNKTWVGVLEGTVEVRPKIELARMPSGISLEAGKSTEVFAGSAPSEPRYLLEEEWKEVQEIYHIGEQPQVALLISMTPRRVHELLRPAALYISSKKADPVPEALIQIASRINKAIVSQDKAKHLDAIHDLESLIAEYPNPGYDTQFFFFIAAYYYYIDEYNSAISTLDGIINKYSSSNLTSLAHCAKGLIYEKDLQDPANAALSYRKILKDHPKSLEAEEARMGLKRLEPPAVTPSPTDS